MHFVWILGSLCSAGFIAYEAYHFLVMVIASTASGSLSAFLSLFPNNRFFGEFFCTTFNIGPGRPKAICLAVVPVAILGTWFNLLSAGFCILICTLSILSCFWT